MSLTATLFCILVYLWFCECEFPQEQCSSEDNNLLELVQVAFVVDGIVPRKDSQWQVDTIAAIADSLEEQFQVEYALTAFWDWSYPATNQTMDANSCYEFMLPWTSNISQIKDAVQNLEEKISPEAAASHTNGSSLMATIFTATDPRTNWNEQIDFVDNDGKVTGSLIALITSHKPTIVFQNTDGRRIPQLDGSDTCTNTLPPPDFILEKVLLEKGIYLVAYVNTEDYNIYIDRAPDLFSWMGAYGIFFDGTVYDQVYNFTKEDIISAWLSSCEWELPPGYNTLGF